MVSSCRSSTACQEWNNVGRMNEGQECLQSLCTDLVFCLELQDKHTGPLVKAETFSSFHNCCVKGRCPSNGCGARPNIPVSETTKHSWASSPCRSPRLHYTWIIISWSAYYQSCSKKYVLLIFWESVSVPHYTYWTVLFVEIRLFLSFAEVASKTVATWERCLLLLFSSKVVFQSPTLSRWWSKPRLLKEKREACCIGKVCHLLGAMLHYF